ncbi:polysaccharide deacetylase family protein [Microbacterium lacticum]
MRTNGASRRVRDTRTTLVAGVILVVAAAGLAACVADNTVTASTPAESGGAPTPTPTPLTAAEQLLADNADIEGACAVSFVLDGATLDRSCRCRTASTTAFRSRARTAAPSRGGMPTKRVRVRHPPTRHPSRGTRRWVNGSDLAACTDHQVTLYGAWTTPDVVAAVGARVPILMYHQFTDKPEGESGWLRGNYSYIEDYRASMQYIKDQAFYLPTWDELSAFIDGALYLPDHAVIVTDDDADPTWLTMAAPINEELQVMATSFDITGGGAAQQNRFILPRSHTNNMHTAGANGKGQMVNLSPAEIAADMQASATALEGIGVSAAGAHEVMAYPFGHYDDRSKEGLRTAGFDLARTIQQGYVTVGSDKLALPCVRVNFGMGVPDVKKLIG